MKIAVVEPEPLNVSLLGGSGVVLNGILEILKRRGYNVTLYSPVIDNKFKLFRSIRNINSIDDKIENFNQFQIYALTRLYCIYSATLLFKFNSYDFTICSSYDQLIGHFDFGYIHFPSRRYFKFSDIIKIRKIRELLDYISSFYFKPKARIIAANSSYTASYVTLLTGLNPYILHPPVTPIVCKESANRENIVVSIGRIVKDKNYEYIIDVAKHFPSLKFIILGRIVDKKYYQELMSKKSENVTIIPNASESLKKEILCKSKVILHTKFDEHFGIAVVEGMSAGLIPVVHKSGGVWTDIVEEGKYGFGFSNLNELLEVLPVALQSEELRKDVVYKSYEFSFTSFEDKFLKITKL